MYRHGKIGDLSFLKAGIKFILQFKLILLQSKGYPAEYNEPSSAPDQVSISWRGFLKGVGSEQIESPNGYDRD